MSRCSGGTAGMKSCSKPSSLHRGNHLIGSFPQGGEADMRGRESQTARVSLRLYIRRIVQMRTYALNVTEPCGGGDVEHRVEVIERT